MKPNKDPTYFVAAKWTVADLTHFLHAKTNRRVPYSTLKRWRQQLGIYPDENLLYSDCDRDGLLGLARWIARGGRVKPYAQRYAAFVQQHSEIHTEVHNA